MAATLAAVAILGGAAWWAAGGGLGFPTTLGAGVSTQRYVTAAGERATVTLSAGEVMRAGRDGSVTVRTADIQRLAGWRDGVIFFEETPLLEAVAEMNRYARQRMVVADAEAGELRVSGAFRSSEADAFAEAMADIFDLSVRRSADGRTVISSKKT